MAIRAKARKSGRRRVVHRTRPRLCVFRSLNHIYAQVIDDARSDTVASASSLDSELRAAKEGKMKTAALVGSLVAKRAMDKGVTQVVFDRRDYKYHGRVKALAEAARQAGLEF
ncbi:MAG: 50S ribosomal protein L18 [Chloroflexi bacterium RBG_13_54_8]|nr:MAG: 50S ribosomal protein L18 [Chloroflexi bacterium RBG_13_54_8]